MSQDQSMNHCQLLCNYSGKYCHNRAGVFSLYFASRAEDTPNFDVRRSKFHFLPIFETVRFIHFLSC